MIVTWIPYSCRNINTEAIPPLPRSSSNISPSNPTRPDRQHTHAIFGNDLQLGDIPSTPSRPPSTTLSNIIPSLSTSFRVCDVLPFESFGCTRFSRAPPFSLKLDGPELPFLFFFLLLPAGLGVGVGTRRLRSSARGVGIGTGSPIKWARKDETGDV
jgi:hypothetical protein